MGRARGGSRTIALPASPVAAAPACHWSIVKPHLQALIAPLSDRHPCDALVRFGFNCKQRFSNRTTRSLLTTRSYATEHASQLGAAGERLVKVRCRRRLTGEALVVLGQVLLVEITVRRLVLDDPESS